MIEPGLVFVGGLLGSSHCIGMCGGFALSIGAGSPSGLANVRRQLAYTAGRIFTYGAIGALAGYGGMKLSHLAASLGNVQAGLAIVAGALLVVQGLAAAGLLRKPAVRQQHVVCLGAKFFAPFLTAPGLGNMFLAGMLTGFLPCGLVYAYVALAAATGTMPAGLVCMAAFGAGTAPAMILFGCGMSLVSLATRRRVFRLAAWCVLVTGLLSVARGATALRAPSPDKACPFCSQKASEIR